MREQEEQNLSKEELAKESALDESFQEESLQEEETAESLTKDQEENLSETDLLEQKLSEMENLLKRQAADFDNFRKRSQEEKENLKGFVLDNLIRDFLPIFDNLERALNSSKSENANLDSIVQGLEGIMFLYQGLLDKHEIQKIDSIGKEFDVHLHEALSTQEGDYQFKTIIQEVEQAYKRNGKVIRTAKVAVGTPKSSDNSESASAEDESEAEIVEAEE